MRSRRVNAGFTLIELLVVIAIVSVLAAFLLPALQKSRVTALSLACSGNLRQLSIWGFQYIDDWNGVLPHNGYWGPPPWPKWGEYSTSYWEAKTPESFRQGTSCVLRCPQAMSSRVGSPTSFWHYGLNTYLGGHRTAYPPRAQLLTSRVFWWMDNRLSFWEYIPFPFGWAGPAPAYGPWMWNTPAQGHPAQSANVLMGDSAVRSLTYGQWNGMSSTEQSRFTLDR